MTQTIEMKPSGVSFGSILKEGENKIANLEKMKDQTFTSTRRNLVFGIGILGGLFLVGMMAANIIAGMLALVVAGVGSVLLWWGARAVKTYDPLVRQKMNNDVIERQIKEARENSIYQLDRAVIDSGERLEAARNARTKIGGQLAKLQEKARRKGETDDSGFYANTIRVLETAYNQIVENVDKAAEAHAEFSRRVKKYHERYEFAESAKELQAMIGSSAVSELDEMLTAAAFDEIDTEFNTALVAIEHLAHDANVDREVQNA
jgi:hypothetical protein